ncbi:MAG: hypothetical protein H0V66_14780 [Bdellovibrionales bacterium]|nr:hypothetical protein [Bdellovibrionales bacterium]
MKSLLILVLLVAAAQAQSSERVCYGKNESCSAKRDLICATVEKMDDTNYRLSRLEHITGCLAWGVSKFKSKNNICKNILAKFGEKRKVRFTNDSHVRGEWETGYRFESIGQIDCEIKE